MDREEEFRDLFADEAPAVGRTVFLILQDRGRAEEVTQDAFVLLLKHWRRVRDYDQPAAWVRMVAVRLAVKAANHDRRVNGALARWRPVPADPNPHPFDTAVSPGVLDAIARLPAKQRAALVLFYFEDRPVAEVAQLLECSPSTAGVHLHRARLRMAELLGEEVTSDVG